MMRCNHFQLYFDSLPSSLYQTYIYPIVYTTGMNQIESIEALFPQWKEKLELGSDLQYKIIRKRMQDQGVTDNQRIMNAVKINLKEVVNSVVEQEKRVWYDAENKDGQISSAGFPNAKEISKKYLTIATQYVEAKYQ